MGKLNSKKQKTSILQSMIGLTFEATFLRQAGDKLVLTKKIPFTLRRNRFPEQSRNWIHLRLDILKLLVAKNDFLSKVNKSCYDNNNNDNNIELVKKGVRRRW